MAIITFKSNEIKETGQTLSLAAVATKMAIEHNYKILIVSTNFKDQTLENCFWELEKLNSTAVGLGGEQVKRVEVGTGIEGLIKVIASNKTTPEIVRNYSKIVLRDRLDVLLSPRTSDYKEYEKIAAIYPEVLQMANRYYDLIFVDLSKRMDETQAENIVQISDVIVVNLTQRLQAIDNFIAAREENDFYKKNNIMLMIGRYDKHSKYNKKNITRYLKERKTVAVIPYNTLYFEACSEGKIIDFFLNIKKVDETDRNYIFAEEANNMANDIIFKLQELQMKL